MALTPEEIKQLASTDAGDEILYNQYREGTLTLAEVDSALGQVGAAQAWIDYHKKPTTTTGLSPTPTTDRTTIAGGTASVPTTTAALTSFQGTLTDPSQIQQLAGVAPTTASTTGPAPVIQTQQVANTATAAPVNPLTTATMTPTMAAPLAPTRTATGTVSPEAVAEVNWTRSAGTQAENTTVQVMDGSIMQAVTGTMTPESIAEAAKVAGLDTSRIIAAKEQLRKAGLTEAQIAAFGNDPGSLELATTQFTDAQRGIIAGLPVEALVSTQMEQLLAGIENGEIPLWARPAVATVESMLTRRGLSASTIGRDALANAIIQAAFPIAQQNAETVKQGAMQQNEIKANASLAEAQFKQQAILQNAQNAFNLNIRNLDAQQQAALANSQFMQTVSLQNASMKQQTAIQNAVNMTQLDMASLDSQTRLAVENAKSFLAMDLANLSNEQQGLMVDAQYEQQRMLSNAAAANAAAQFNAQSENQTQQFMAGLKANIDQFNAQQLNAIATFNATEVNRTAAVNAGNQIAVDQFNAQLMTQVDQFNSQQELAVQQWNAANAQAVEQSNVAWRRQANTADTAAQNAINQQNVQNAFNLSAQAQAAMWQEMRDQATFSFQAAQSAEDRRAQLYAVAIGNKATTADTSYDPSSVMQLVDAFFGNT
jgi:hypothetical protein